MPKIGRDLFAAKPRDVKVPELDSTGAWIDSTGLNGAWVAENWTLLDSHSNPTRFGAAEPRAELSTELRASEDVALVHTAATQADVSCGGWSPWGHMF